MAHWVKKPGRASNGMFYYFHLPNKEDNTVTRCGAPTEPMTESIELDGPKKGKCCERCMSKMYIEYRRETSQ